MAGTTIDTDDQLVARAGDGDSEALAALLERHLHPAWRIALAASPTPAAAEEAVVAGFCDALNAAGRRPDATVSLRTRIAAAVHAAALAADRPEARVAPEGADPVVAAFATLPPASRTALWLTAVEGGDADKAAPVLGVAPGVAAAMAARANKALRAKAEVAIIKPALRRIVTPVPASLPGAVAERWAQTGGRDRPPAVRRFNQRLVGVAAAAVVAIGLAGAVLFAGGGGGAGPRLAAPAGTVDLSGLADGATPTTSALGAPALPTGTAVLSAGAGSDRPASADAADRARGGTPAPPTTTVTTAPPATTTTSTTTPTTSTTTSTTAPPSTVAASDPNPSPAPPVTVVLPEEPGDAPVIEIEVPGLETIEIPVVLP